MIKNSISVLIYTSKEDKNIEDCLKSGKLLTDNIILVYPDSKFVETIRETGIKQAKTDWVLILDVDERLTPELAKEVKNVIAGNRVTHYKIPRKNIFGKNKWLSHGGWCPDHQVRLINTKYFINWPKRIHSTPKIKGEMGYLKNPLLHYFHGDLEKMVEKTIIFEDIESDLLYRANRTVSTSTFFRKYFAELGRRLFRYMGFLDGTIGIVESMYQAFSKTITYLFLYEKKHKSKSL